MKAVLRSFCPRAQIPSRILPKKYVDWGTEEKKEQLLYSAWYFYPTCGSLSMETGSEVWGLCAALVLCPLWFYLTPVQWYSCAARSLIVHCFIEEWAILLQDKLLHRKTVAGRFYSTPHRRTMRKLWAQGVNRPQEHPALVYNCRTTTKQNKMGKGMSEETAAEEECNWKRYS